jgi:hypothetical protein
MHILAVHLFNYVLNKSLNARILETHSGLIPLILIHQINYFIFPYLKQNLVLSQILLIVTQ